MRELGLCFYGVRLSRCFHPFFNTQLGQMQHKSDRAVVAGERCKMYDLTGDMGRSALVLKVRSLCL